MRFRLPVFTLTVLISLVAFVAAVSATEFEYSIANKTSQSDGDLPTLVLTAKSFVEGGKVSLKSATGGNKTVKLGSLSPGQDVKIPLKVKEGTHLYQATIEAKDAEGATVTIPLEFQVIRVPSIKVSVDKERVDTGSGKIIFESSRPVERVDAVFFDESGGRLGAHTQSFGGRYGELEFAWPAAGPKLGGIELKVYDVDGFWTGVMLEPWWIEIEHKDIIFDFGKDTWQPAEEPKLTASVAEIQKQMEKNPKHRKEMRLYVAGYTDSVGSAADNQKLSQQRAKAIARWFRANGVSVDLYYQGFGEEGQAVKTKDNVEEARNRRAVYLLGNGPPPKSLQMPASRWSKI